MAFYTSEMEAERTEGKSNFEKNGIWHFGIFKSFFFARGFFILTRLSLRKPEERTGESLSHAALSRNLRRSDKS